MPGSLPAESTTSILRPSNTAREHMQAAGSSSPKRSTRNASTRGLKNAPTWPDVFITELSSAVLRPPRPMAVDQLGASVNIENAPPTAISVPPMRGLDASVPASIAAAASKYATKPITRSSRSHSEAAAQCVRGEPAGHVGDGAERERKPGENRQLGRRHAARLGQIGRQPGDEEVVSVAVRNVLEAERQQTGDRGTLR